MKNSLIVTGTLLALAAANWAIAYFLQFAFLDIAILFAALALAIIYFFKSKGGMASRQMDMAIQGQTGIRMEHKVAPSERSYIFIGSLLYMIIVLGITFFAYREYFFS